MSGIKYLGMTENGERFVLHKRSLAQRLLRVPRVFLSHYRTIRRHNNPLAALIAAWRLTLTLFK